VRSIDVPATPSVQQVADRNATLLPTAGYAPMYECCDDRTIVADLAARLGINDYDDKTEVVHAWRGRRRYGGLRQCAGPRSVGAASDRTSATACCDPQRVRGSLSTPKQSSPVTIAHFSH